VGVNGWRVCPNGENTVLVGTLESVEFSGGLTGDHDWNLEVKPDPAWAHLLQAPKQPGPNSNGIVECEVQPIDGFDSEDALNTFFQPLLGQPVKVVGTWVQDCSHSYHSTELPSVPTSCDDGKTEIHPIHLIQILDGSQLHVWALSEASKSHPTDPTRPNPVPGAGDSVPVQVFADWPPPDADGPQTPEWSILSETNLAASRSFSMTSDATGAHLTGEIMTGDPFASPAQGFYVAAIQLGYTGPVLRGHCNPAQIVANKPVTFTVVATDPSGKSVVADLWLYEHEAGGVIRKSKIGQSGEAITYTFQERLIALPPRGEGGPSEPAMSMPTLWVRARGYVPAQVAVDFVLPTPSPPTPQPTPGQLTVACTPPTLRRNATDTFTVSAKDASTGHLVSGNVLVDGDVVGKTNQQLTHTFSTSPAARMRAEGGSTPPPAPYGVVTVEASNYQTALVHVTFD
jgi:hypothetical protein